MSTSSRTCALIATLASACTTAPADDIAPYVDSNKADGHAHHLHLLDRHKLNVDEPSDLALAAGKLFTVSDAHSKIYEIDDDGDVHSELDIDGHDLEAVAVDAHGEFLVADETRAKIWHIAADGERHDPIFVPDAEDGNSGIEGLTFGPTGNLLVAKEKQPARILELTPAGEILSDTKIRFADDLSALTYNPDDKHLYALSDEDHSLYRLDADWEVETAWKLPVAHPEGVVFDGDVIYICSDSEERLYAFAVD